MPLDHGDVFGFVRRFGADVEVIGQGATRTQETSRLSDAVETLRRENGDLKTRLEKLESAGRKPASPGAKAKAAKSAKKPAPKKGRRG